MYVYLHVYLCTSVCVYVYCVAVYNVVPQMVYLFCVDKFNKSQLDYLSQKSTIWQTSQPIDISTLVQHVYLYQHNVGRCILLDLNSVYPKLRYVSPLPINVSIDVDCRYMGTLIQFTNILHA